MSGHDMGWAWEPAEVGAAVGFYSECVHRDPLASSSCSRLNLIVRSSKYFRVIRR